MKKHIRIVVAVLAVTALLTFAMVQIRAADHGDTPLLSDAGNLAAQIADLYVFRNPNDDSQVVIALTFNPFIPAGTTVVPFDEDVTYIINIDNRSETDNDGNVVEPERIKAGTQIRAGIMNGGVDIDIFGDDIPITALFIGLRDDPFIVTPVNDNAFNINALVIQVPLDRLLNGSETLLFWAQTRTKGFPGRFQESAAKPDTSTVLNTLNPDFDLDAFNQTRPRDQLDEFGSLLGAEVLPDVLVFRPDNPDGFPNGRTLEDDVIDIIAGQFPGDISADPATENNVPFLENFPFLAPPNK